MAEAVRKTTMIRTWAQQYHFKDRGWQPHKVDVLDKRCAECGALHPPFGFGVNIARRQAGKWYCRQHVDIGRAEFEQARHNNDHSRRATVFT